MQPGDLKNIGYASPTSWLQNVDYRYNIRGWLMSINNSKLTPDGGKTNYDSNDVFGMQLMYDKADSALSNSHYFNGKPSGIKWMTRYGNNTRTPERSFLFTYDGFNRYTAETYAERDSLLAASNPFNQNVHGFDENSITYNANGNLLTLKRNSSVIGAGSHKQIDSLVYSYNANSLNQLLKVTDGTDSVHAGHGFRSIDSTANYSYDSNGNLFNDHFKGMELRYDVLNRTDKITVTTAGGQFIDYTYDADGNLLRKRAYSGGMLQTTTDYIDGFVYITVTTGTPALSYFPMPEGRVVNVSGALTQEFIMTDQQGNARVAFRNVGGIAKVYQENSYYGTGLILPNSPVGAPAVPNKKLYNGGSEWQNDSPVGATYPYNLPDYYETYNRNYDAAIGRFIGVDPMAESAESMSSYQYAGGNPIIANDPDGALADISKQARVPSITSRMGSEFEGVEAEELQTENDWFYFGGVTSDFPIFGMEDVTYQYVGAGGIIGVIPGIPLTDGGRMDINGPTGGSSAASSTNSANPDIEAARDLINYNIANGATPDQNPTIMLYGENVTAKTESYTFWGDFVAYYGFLNGKPYMIMGYNNRNDLFQSFNGIQTVYSYYNKVNQLSGLPEPHVDGTPVLGKDGKAKTTLNYPFYWKGTKIQMGELEYLECEYGLDYFLQDMPASQTFFYAESTIFAVIDNVLIPLGSYSWGYTFGPSGQMIFIVPKFSLIQSQFQLNVINKFNTH